MPEQCPVRPRLTSYGAAVRAGDLACVGASQEQVRAGRRQHPLQEAVQDPERVLDAVAPGNETTTGSRLQSGARRSPRSWDERRASPWTRPCVVVRGGGRDSGGQAEMLQDRPGGAL
jgi:hypothetical protein